MRVFDEYRALYGGVIWGCAATKAGATYALLGAAFLFLISLVLKRNLKGAGIRTRYIE
jgi:hypothetical protein